MELTVLKAYKYAARRVVEGKDQLQSVHSPREPPLASKRPHVEGSLRLGK